MDDPPTVHGQRIRRLLLRWQASADPSDLESLIRVTSHLMERVAQATLRRHHISDPDAVDDTTSLVLDHLRRLPGSSPSERGVARFACRNSADGADHGEAYIVWLTTERARDVARGRRRIDRRLQRLSFLSSTMHFHATRSMAIASRDDVEDHQEATAVERMRQAIDSLEPRLAIVMRLLLDGITQSAIAARLGVCEGTVSRMRVRAIAHLRQTLMDDRAAGG